MAGSPLPPRTRGRLLVLVPGGLDLASTPAHAGPTMWWAAPTRRAGLYPRARGADARPAGLAPGTPASTPAHAGPTSEAFFHLGADALYPRARGADSPVARACSSGRPLPPRTRGRPRAPNSAGRPRTSTPAHAGPTFELLGPARFDRLYPRARGADLGQPSPRGDGRPLPPRTRGRRSFSVPLGRCCASTPAHAGPTDATNKFKNTLSPLPPRTRGRRWLVFTVTSWVASTPAHAGPTRSWSGLLSRWCLYPRARGADA
mgnify:CR=1 FL=1